MKDEIIDVAFTKSLNDFLTKTGYTHIFSLGVDDADVSPDSDDKVVYWLQPLKPGDSRIANDDTSFMVSEIKSDDIIDMATGQDNTIFMIRVPVEDMDTYLKDR